MSNLQTFLSELDAYCKAAQISAFTVCRKATGDPRLHERLIDRDTRIAGDITALRQYMKANPPKCADAPSKTVTPERSNQPPEESSTCGCADGEGAAA